MDSGYSWVICAANFAGLFFVMTGVAVFGVMYEEFLNHFQASNAETAMIISFNNALGAFSGLVLDPIIRRYGCRPVAVAGTLLGTVGYGSCFFAQSIFHLCIGYGILSGIANGMLLFSGTVVLNRYFDRRRSLAAAIASCGVSCSPLVLPPVIRWLTSAYGWRTTMLAVAGFYLQNCIGASLMRPPPPLPPPPPPSKPLNGGETGRRNTEANNARNADRKEDSKNGGCHRRSFLRYLLLPFRSVWKSLDITMFRDPRVTIFLVGTSVGLLGYFPPLVFVAAYATSSFGFSSARASVLPSVVAGAMLGGRITSGVLGDSLEFLKTPRRRVCQYSIPAIACGFASASAYLVESGEALVAYCCVVGFFTGVYIVVQQPVIVDLFGLDRLPNIFSLLLLFNGVVSFLAQPFSGWLVDVSGTFGLVFVVSGLIQVLSSLLLLVLVPLTPPSSSSSSRTNKQIEHPSEMELEITVNSSTLGNHLNKTDDADLCNNNSKNVT